MLLLFNPLAFQSIRKEKRLTQRALADRIIFDERYISALENGERQNPSVLFLVKCSFVMGEPIHRFMRPANEHGGLILPTQHCQWDCCEHRCKCKCPYSPLHMPCTLKELLFSPYEQS